MSKAFNSFEDVQACLNGYRLADITLTLADSNISEFVKPETMAQVLEVLPANRINAFFSKVIPDFRLSKEALFSLLRPLPLEKKWQFFCSFAPRLEEGITWEDIGFLRAMMPRYQHYLRDLGHYRSFSITSAEEARNLLQFFICERLPTLPRGAYSKLIHGGNEEIVQTCLSSPQNVAELVQSGTDTCAKTAAAQFLADMLPHNYFNNLFQDDTQFDHFLRLLNHLDNQRKWRIARQLLQPNCLPLLNDTQRRQVAACLSVNGCSNVSRETVAALYNNGLLTAEQFFNFCLTLSRESCRLHSMDALPDNLTDYENDYIFIGSHYPLTLYYIHPGGVPTEVKIHDIYSLEKNIRRIRGDGTLTAYQISNLITSNGGHTPPDDIDQIIVTLCPEKLTALFNHANEWLNRVRPSREAMKRYQRYQERLYAIVFAAGEIIHTFTPRNSKDPAFCCLFICCSPLMLMAYLVALAVAIIGLIPALIGLCLEIKKTQAEQAFIDSCGLNDPEVSADVMDARYLNSQLFWRAERTQRYCGSISSESRAARSSDASSTDEQSLTIPCH
ncbi:hypothetical protein E3226_005655 [Legionella geestiana]|uniref:hypothetical protein n=1 Tax=Legionella geestiana TaxID=45065 RepID=UPI0010920076|nr:hypothetical protein [Legionella geestiana]QDQ39918.1 hypothetical protein E3226_005655 [Legionella geestiana]